MTHPILSAAILVTIVGFAVGFLAARLPGGDPS
jgi:hypothetical protein